jgi:putative spermidine/putrescine transport system ATP-binding protein
VFPVGSTVPEAHAHADGEVKAISYQGAVTRFSVEAEKLRICAEVPATGTSFKEGDKVRLIWPKAAMVTMEEGA